MIIDTSALIAILFNEDDADLYANALASSEHRLMSAANYLESGIVIDRQRGAAAGRQLDSLILRAEVKVESVTKEQADIARQAYLDFGKGAHPAGLNFGDCFSYALAKSLGLPLLFKGEDFALTDIESVL
jgi:ribonuclease VapC